MLSGTKAFLEILKDEGVQIVFGNPGTTELPLMDGLVREPAVRYVLALHESVAVGMADGYALAGARLGVVNLHAAPGIGNAMGMLYNAQKSGAPLLVTAGQHDQSFNTTEPVVWADLPPIAQPFVKWSSEVRRIQELPRLVRRATKTALCAPTGPVFLSLPVDVLAAEADLDLLAPTRVSAGTPGDQRAIEEAADLLARAERPLIVAGDAVAHGDALAELVELAELVGCPVVNECMASTCSFPFTHPQYAGSMTRLAPQIFDLLSRHDLLFSVGADLFTLSLPDPVNPMPPGLTVVHLDTNPWELGKNYPAQVAIQADPKAALPRLCEALRSRTTREGHREAGRRREAAQAAHREARETLESRAAEEAARSPMTPLSLVRAVAEGVPADVTIVEEVLSSVGGIRHLFRCADAKALFGMRGGGIGWAVPAALGVALALPSRPVVALVGDGSAMYTNQALWTAARESIPVVIVVFNNACYRILKQRVLSLKGFSACDDTFVGMDLDRPLIDHVGLARSLGVPGERVERTQDVAPAIRRGLKSGGPYLLEARIASA